MLECLHVHVRRARGPTRLLNATSERKSLKTGKLPHLVVKYGNTDKRDETNVHPRTHCDWSAVNGIRVTYNFSVYI